jgi:predicted outer membrane repeat protein
MPFQITSGSKERTMTFLGATNLANSTDSKGTIYYDLSFSKEIAEKITLVAHYGKTAYSSYKQLDYDDYKIGVNIDVNGWILGLAYINNSGLTTTGKTFTTNSADTSGGAIAREETLQERWRYFPHQNLLINQPQLNEIRVSHNTAGPNSKKRTT